LSQKSCDCWQQDGENVVPHKATELTKVVQKHEADPLKSKIKTAETRVQES
jgi:hypothetical protein